MKDLKKIGLSLAALLLGIAGCTVGPDYHPPKMAVAPSYHGLSPASETNQASKVVPAAEPVQRWWTLFHDPQLESLIDRALKGNRDLLQAVSRIRQARAQRSVVASGLFPEVDATGGYDHALGSKNVVIPLGAIENGGSGASSGAAKKTSVGQPAKLDAGGESSTAAGSTAGAGAPLGGPNSPFGLGGLPGVTSDIYQVGLETSWEIDLFGGTRRSIQAAVANIMASEEDRRVVLIQLLADVATNYMTLRAQQQRLGIAQDNLADQKKTLAILQARFTNGLSTELDISQQLAEVDTTAASIPPLQSAEQSSLHILAFLIGQPPDALITELSPRHPLPSVPAVIPVGIPSDLLRRRPDIRRAERQLAAATAQIGVAKANLFPKFSLTGVAGMDASQPGNLLDWNSRYFAISPGVSWPILDWGRIRGNIRVQNEVQAQFFTAYQDTVLHALKEVEDALVFYANEQVRRTSLAGAVSASENSLALARKSYESGLVDLLTVLNAERSVLTAQDSLARSDAAIRNDLVKLYLALGGGWD